MIHRYWSDEDNRKLHALADIRLPPNEIAAALQRTPKAIRRQAWKLGISLDPRRIVPRASSADQSLWTQADRISMWARVPHELAELVVDTAARFNVSVQWLRSESRDTELVRCRKDIASKAREGGHSFPVIGRALNRDHTTVMAYFREGVEA